MKLDLLFFAAHPDDIELAASGTVAKHIKAGKKVGIIDFTKGEMGTRGTPELRMLEAQKSADILGITIRENLGFKDVFFSEEDPEHKQDIVKVIRKYQPNIIIGNAPEDRHPDHIKAAKIVQDAFFLTGLKNYITFDGEEEQQVYRPKALYHYIQSRYCKPDFIVDISEEWDTKMESILAFSSQFSHPDYVSDEPQTFISDPRYLKSIEGRARDFGYEIGATFGEGFTVNRGVGVDLLTDLI